MKIPMMRYTHPKLLSLGMSNFDHSIDNGLSEALRADPAAMAQYSGYNFCAYVCSLGSQFQCEVWLRNSPIETILADSLEAIMEKVSDKYGYE